MPTKCNVINCTSAALAKGLCNTHYKRQYRNGTQQTLRPTDWGKRHAHPAYNAWRTLHRVYAREIPDSWQDFWTFVSEVPEKPGEGKSTATRERPEEPWSPSNFYWRTPVTTVSYREDRATYMREYQRAKRASNSEYGRNADLKRHYGVDLEWYNAKLDEQNGRCAICKTPETAIISGRRLSLAVDHCHTKGHVRGLLCSDCNRAVGLFRDDPKIMRAAIRYLENDTADPVAKPPHS